MRAITTGHCGNRGHGPLLQGSVWHLLEPAMRAITTGFCVASVGARSRQAGSRRAGDCRLTRLELIGIQFVACE